MTKHNEVGSRPVSLSLILLLMDYVCVGVSVCGGCGCDLHVQYTALVRGAGCRAARSDDPDEVFSGTQLLLAADEVQQLLHRHLARHYKLARLQHQ